MSNGNRIFMLKNRAETPSMVKVTQQGEPTGMTMRYPNSYSLPAEELIFDPKLKVNRIIRYVLGETSIYKDEQSSLKDVPVKVQRIEFVRGTLMVRPEEPTLLAYMLASSLNESNPTRDKTKNIVFFEYKPETDATAEMDKNKVLIEAMNFCHTAPWKELRVVATVLGIDTNQTPDEIKHHMLKGFAERDPKKFLETLNDKSNIRVYTIREAIKTGALLIDTKTNSITWADGNMICMAPVGVDPVLHLKDQTFADTRGLELYELIVTKANPAIVGAPKEAEDKFKIQLPTDIGKSLVDKAIEGGIIIDKTPWFFYKDMKWQGKLKLLKELTDNLKLKEEITNAVAKLVTA